MALREQFESSGGWLFRWRGYVPLAIIALIVFVMRDFHYLGNSPHLNALWEMGCAAISFLGLGIRAYTIGHTPKNTSGRNAREQRAESLNTSGIYSIVRHPLYLGGFFIYLGIVLVAHVWWLAVICVLAYWLYYERIMFAEEFYLRGKFRSAFEQWAERTPAFVPDVRLWQPPDLPFSLKNVLRREYNNFFGAVLILFVLDGVGRYFAEGQVRLDPAWTIFLGVGFTIWIVLRTIKRNTEWLRVPGR
jgi:protein-S-isoprenylcysteine O-methyltransferase Ste14